MDSYTIDVPKPQRTEEEFQELVFEQMPQVKYIARRIHEHLPSTCPSMTLCTQVSWA